MLEADGLKKAFLGIGRRCGQPDIAVYSIPKCIEALMEDDGMSYEDAVDCLEFNTLEAWVRPETPIFVQPHDPDRNDG